MFEIVIAIGIFVTGITSLVVALNAAIDASLQVRQEAMIMTKLQNRLEEARFQPMEEGRFPDEREDPDGVLFIREISPLELETEEGVEIQNLWRLRVIARWDKPDGSTGEDYVEIFARDMGGSGGIIEDR
jgi:hypothetical protein